MIIGEGAFIKKLRYDLNDERVKYLISTDERLNRLIRHIYFSELEIEEDGFKCLMKYIIGQQISDKARQTLWQRICSKFDNLTPNKVLCLNNSELRGIGLSEHKVSFIKNLASAIACKRINFEQYLTLKNEEIIRELTAVKGIGRWTAEMYLIFSLGREDILSSGDGTIKRVIMWMYDLETLPSKKDLWKYFGMWSQYATIVSSYFWKANELGLTQQHFDQSVINIGADI